jgi:hypothetical protein
MYVVIVMTTLAVVRPLNLWNYDSIRPGPVGSVGVVNAQPRLKQSTPEMEMRWDTTFAHNKEKRLGSNVSDGQWKGYTSGGGVAETVDTNWGMRRDFTTSRGWMHQDMRTADRTHDPVSGGTPSYSWHNKIATVYEAKRTGNNFLPKFDKVGLPRGGQTMRVTDTAGGEDVQPRTNVGMHTDMQFQGQYTETSIANYQKSTAALSAKRRSGLL